MRTRLVRQLEALAACQPDHGVWSVLVDDQPENAGILETSAAAGLGAAMLRASQRRSGLADAVVEAGWRAVAGALAYVEDGTLTRVSAGTVLQLVPFGYSVIRDDRPQLWGQGLALHAVAAALAARQGDPAATAARRGRRGPTMSTILCVGEALISLTPPVGTPLQEATDLLISTGGAEVNVAAHLARLGVPTRFAGRVGDDPFGERLRQTLAELGVDTRFLEVDAERPTGLYVKDANGSGTTMRYYRNASAATSYRHVPDEALDDVEHVHVTGITPALSEDCRSLVEDLLALPHVTTSFDVNYRSALWGVTEAAGILRSLAEQANTVFVGLDEAGDVWGCRTFDDVRRATPPAVRTHREGRLHVRQSHSWAHGW